MSKTYSSYSQMYKTLANSCLYTSKINIYINPAFNPLLPSQLCPFPIYPPSAPSASCCNKCTISSSCTSCCNTPNQPYNCASYK